MNKQWLFNRIQRIIFYCIGIIYMGGLVYVFFFARRRWRTFPIRNFNLIPFQDKIEYVQSHTMVTRAETWEFYKDLLGNIFIFIPFPILLCFFFGVKKYRKLFLFSIITSLCVELIQFMFNIGVADIDDVILNTIGAGIGLLILYAVSRLIINISPRLLPAK